MIEAKCEKIFCDDEESQEQELAAALRSLSANDTLVITQFVKLGKTIKGLVDLVQQLEQRSICLVSIEDGVDTRTADGRLLVHLLSRLALMDKTLLAQRTQVSLAIAKAKGRTGGRPPALTPDQLIEAKKLVLAGMPVREVAKVIGSNQATIYRLVGAKPI